MAAGSVTSTKQFIWCADQRCEERDASGSLTKQFFGRGQKNGTTSYFYTKDHLGSIREMADGSGTVQGQLNYDAYGRAIRIVSNQAPDVEYAGYYLNQTSGLNLTRTRVYSPTIGRFINRDPIGMRGGRNLYDYVGNSPINKIDPSGLLTGYVSNTGYIAQTPSVDYGNGSANYTGATQWNGSEASQSGQGQGWTGTGAADGNPPLPPSHGCATGGDNGDDDDDDDDDNGVPQTWTPPSLPQIPPPPPPDLFTLCVKRCYKKYYGNPLAIMNCIKRDCQKYAGK